MDASCQVSGSSVSIFPSGWADCFPHESAPPRWVPEPGFVKVWLVLQGLNQHYQRDCDLGGVTGGISADVPQKVIRFGISNLFFPRMMKIPSMQNNMSRLLFTESLFFKIVQDVGKRLSDQVLGVVRL